MGPGSQEPRDETETNLAGSRNSLAKTGRQVRTSCCGKVCTGVRRGGSKQVAEQRGSLPLSEVQETGAGRGGSLKRGEGLTSRCEEGGPTPPKAKGPDSDGEVTAPL